MVYFRLELHINREFYHSRLQVTLILKEICAMMELEFSGLIDMKLAVVLWLIGLGIKHLDWKCVKQLSNKLIPTILIITGIGLECVFMGDVTFDGILSGVITAIFAVGVHSSGKNVLRTLMGLAETDTLELNDLSGSASSEYFDESSGSDDASIGNAVG